MQDSLRWGIVGTGKIARKMADALRSASGCHLQAVGSRDLESALAFRMANKAREKNLFLMEAMWTRFLPAIKDVKVRLVRGDIGELRMLSADFGFRSDYDPDSRLFKPELGGGALLDVGIYPVSLAHHLLGKPCRIHAEAAFSPLETDEQTAILLKFPAGQLATLSCAVRTTTVHEAILSGTEGTIRIQPDWWRGSRFLLIGPNGSVEKVEPSTYPNGFVYEVEETVRCLREGLKESTLMPLAESIAVMETMDTIASKSRGNY